MTIKTSKEEKVRAMAEARETLRRTDPTFNVRYVPETPPVNLEVQRRLRELEQRCATPKPRAAAAAEPAPRTDAENARHFNQLIDNAVNAQRQFIVEVVGGALGEATAEVANEAAAHAEDLIKSLERQLLELRAMDLPELPKMRDIN